MSSMQTLQHKLDSLQEEYNGTAGMLKAQRQQLGIETDVSERYKLENQIKQAEAKLDQLDQKIQDLEHKKQAIKSGHIKLDDVLKQEGLQSPAKPTPRPGKQLIILTAVGAIGFGVLLTGILANSGVDDGSNSSGSNSSEQSMNQPQSGLDSRFAGAWTTEGNLQSSHSMNLILQNSNNNELTGTLETSERRGATTSGLLSVSGTGQGDVAQVILYDQQAAAIGEAELRLEGENLVWRLKGGSNVLFPPTVTLYRGAIQNP
jgi:hypothetical protein